MQSLMRDEPRTVVYFFAMMIMMMIIILKLLQTQERKMCSKVVPFLSLLQAAIIQSKETHF